MAFNTVYQRVNPIKHQMPKPAVTDPAYAIGYLLGKAWADNYEQRGTDKATQMGMDEMDKAFGKVPQSEPAPQDLIDQAMTLSVGGNTVGAESVEKASGEDSKAKSTIIRPEIDHGLLKYGYLMDKYKNSPNPVTEAISTKNIVQDAEAGLSKANMDFVPKAVFKQQYMQKMIDNKIPIHQREAGWAAVEPVFDARKAEYDEQRTNELVEQYLDLVDQGKYREAEETSLLVGKYNPAVANYLQRNNITHKDMWVAEKANEAASAKAANEVAKIITKERVKAAFGGGGSSGGQTAKINAAKAILEDEERHYKSNPNVPYPKAKEAEQARITLSEIVGYRNSAIPSAPSKVKPFVDKYNKLRKEDVSSVTQALSSDTELISFLQSATPAEIQEFENATGIVLPRK